jgi:hypothetical protein
MAMFLSFGTLFLDCLIKLVQFLAQLHKRLLCRIGFLSAFLGGTEIGSYHSVFLIPTTILCDVCSIPTPMLLAEVTMLLGASFLGYFGCRLGTSSLVPFLAPVESFLGGLCIGSYLGTYALSSLKRHEKQMYVHGHHTFLVKVELFQTVLDQFVLRLIQIRYIQICYIQFCVKLDT